MAYFIKVNLRTCQLKRAVCICAAEREVIGQGYHYDNDHN